MVIWFLKIANTFNEYFGSIAESLNLHISTEGSSNVPRSYTSDDGTDKILIKFVNYPGIEQSYKTLTLLVNFCFNVFL